MPSLKPDVLKQIESRFDTLSPRLSVAARFVLNRPKEIALYSMRAAAAKAKVHPTSMLRLARELGFDGYDAFRDEFRNWLNKSKGETWSTRAHSMQNDPKSAQKVEVIESIFRQETANLQSAFDETMCNELIKAADLIKGARSLYIVGLRSLYPAAFYTSYVCKMFMSNVVLINGSGGTFADELRNIGQEDVLLAFSYDPYTRNTIMAVEFALKQGAKLVAITDSVVSPITKKNQLSITVPNESPSLFPTITPSLVVAQALTALLLSDASEATMEEIRRSENQLDAFHVYTR